MPIYNCNTHVFSDGIVPEGYFAMRLAEMGYDPEFGARPLKRVIQQHIEDNLSDTLLAGEFEDGDTVVVDVVEDEISLRKQEDDENPLDVEEGEEEEMLAAS